MYNQEVYDIIARLKEKIKDEEFSDDLHMLSLYSEMRSNALHDLDRKVTAQVQQIRTLVDSLDSAEADMDNMEISNRQMQSMFTKAALSAAEMKQKMGDTGE